jgi:hydroxyacylglutathione hydrolase
VKVGRVELESLDTPGHTMSHVCLLSHTDQPALICGDTMFNAGAGNCHNGGHPAELYHTFTGQIAKLPDDTQIYPGHDYLTNNLEFTLSREPNNTAAKAMLDKLQDTHDPDNATITTLGQEKEINTFFRLHNPEIIETLRGEFPELSPDPEPMEIFLKLRELRNSW